MKYIYSTVQHYSWVLYTLKRSTVWYSATVQYAIAQQAQYINTVQYGTVQQYRMVQYISTVWYSTSVQYGTLPIPPSIPAALLAYFIHHATPSSWAPAPAELGNTNPFTLSILQSSIPFSVTSVLS